MKFKKAPLKLPYFIFLISLFSCNPVKQEDDKNFFAPKRVKVSAYSVPVDSLHATPTQPVKKPKKIIAGKPNFVPSNPGAFSVHEKSSIIELNDKAPPALRTPGQQPFKFPTRVAVGKKNIVPAIPEIVAVKEGATKDHNPSNFTYYKVLHGLKQSAIRCLYEDSKKKHLAWNL